MTFSEFPCDKEFKKEILLYYKDTNVFPEGYTYTLSVVEQTIKNGVGVLRLNDGKMNALTFQMLWEMLFCIEYFERLDEVRVILWGSKGKCFSAGANLSSLTDTRICQRIMDGYNIAGKGMYPNKGNHRPDYALTFMVRRMLNLRKVSIVAVHGACIGGSANFAILLHDFCLASHSAKFRYPFSSLCIPPEVGSSRLLPNNIGMGTAKRLLMLGEYFTSEEACRLGLVMKVVADDELYNTAFAFALRIAQSPQMAGFEAIKRLMNTHVNKEMSDMEILSKERTAFTAAVESDAFKVALKTFKKVHEKTSKM